MNLPPANTRFLRLFFADFLQSHVLPVKLNATGIGYARGFERYDDVVAGACDCARASVPGTICKGKLDGSFGSDFAVAVGDWLDAVTIVVTGAEPYRQGVSALLQAHLKRRLAV